VLKTLPSDSIDASTVLPHEVTRPWSIGQREIWRALQLSADPTVFNIGGHVEIRAAIDLPRFIAAVRHTVQDIDTMRLCLRETSTGIEPVQIAQVPFVMPVIDLRHEPDPRETALQMWHSQTDAPYDLSAAPLARFALLQLAEDHFMWIIGMHHLIGDYFTATEFTRRVTLRYEAPDASVANAMSWSHYLDDERDYLNSERCVRDHAYWQGLLQQDRDAATLSGLPPAQPGEVTHAQGSLPASLCEALEVLGRVHRGNMVTVLFAAVALYLHRLSGSRSIVLTMTTSGRTSKALREVIGTLSNTVPLCIDVDPGAGLAQLLEHVGTRMREAMRHQRFPAALQRQVPGGEQVVRSGTIVNFIPEDPEFTLGGQRVSTRIHIHARRVEDLLIVFHSMDGGRGLSVHFGGHQSHYDEASLGVHLERFIRCLRRFTDHAELPLRSLPFLDDAERGHALTLGRGPDAPPLAPTLARFEAWAAGRPQQLAARAGDESMSYGQLNARANALARELIAAGAGPESILGLCVDRSFEMLIGILGIWKAGAAYLPLDLSHPPERVAAMLHDAQVSHVVCAPALLTQWQNRAPAGGPLRTVPIGSARSTQDIRDAERRAPLRLDHPAYVIYTSGSTGTPKGVVVTHVALNTLAAATAERWQLREDSRVLQYAALNFDVSVWDLVTTLSAGAALVMRPESAAGGTALSGVLLELQVTHCWLPPSVLQTLSTEVAHGWAVQCLTLGAEACPADLAATWASQVRLLNSYGPTEASITVTMSEPLDGEAVPLGSALSGVQLYVLDHNLELVPAGVAGELYIGAAYLARGYLGRRGLTAERFVADPFGEPGSRMYRTGDRVRWREDGNLEFLGRTDDQVKLRGHRIELGEVEATLRRMAGVSQCAVVMRTDSPGGPYLAAYVTSDGAAPSLSSAREFLAASLPHYMLPSAVMVLGQLPRTPGGKLDRRALPIPALDAGRNYAAPQGRIETLMAVRWCELLKIERAGREDNFFELGGSSLLLVHLLELLRHDGLVLDAQSVFAHPTIAALAPRVRVTEIYTPAPANAIPAQCRHITPAMLPLIDLQQVEIDAIASQLGGHEKIQDIYPLAPLQEGILIHHRLATGRDAYLLLALLAFETPAQRQVFCEAMQSVIQRHDILRTAFLWEGLREPAQVVLREARLSTQPVSATNAPVEHALWAMGSERIDVRRAPLMRLFTAEDMDGRALLLWQCHHLVSDHVTVELILEEMRARMAGTTVATAATVPYRDFVHASRAVARDSHREFFRAMLRGYTEPVVPYGLRDVHGDGSQLGEHAGKLEAGLAQQVRSSARRLGTTSSALFHLVWSQVLARLGDATDVVFGTVLFGRMHGMNHMQRAAGLFINTLPLRLNLTGLSVRAALRETHAALSGLLMHEHASLAVAQASSDVAPGVPLFTTLLNYRHGLDGGPSLAPGVTLLRVEERTNYPLSLTVDDLGSGFELTVQASAPADASHVYTFAVQILEHLLCGSSAGVSKTHGPARGPRRRRASSRVPGLLIRPLTGPPSRSSLPSGARCWQYRASGAATISSASAGILCWRCR